MVRHVARDQPRRVPRRARPTRATHLEHHVRGPGRPHPLRARQRGSEALARIRLDPAGRRLGPAHRLAGLSRAGRAATAARSTDRLDPEHQLDSLPRDRRRPQPPVRGLPAVHGARTRQCPRARVARHPGRRLELDVRGMGACRVRHPRHRGRRPHPGDHRRMGAARRERPRARAPARLRHTRAARMGPRQHGRVRAHDAVSTVARADAQARRRYGGLREDSGTRAGDRAARTRLGDAARTLGRGQPAPAHPHERRGRIR